MFIRCSSASSNTKRTNETSLAHVDSPECKKAKNEDDIFFNISLNLNGAQQQIEFYAKIIQNNDPNTNKYSIRSNSIIYRKDSVLIAQDVLLKAQIKIKYDKIDAQFDYSQEKEIFSNHIQQTNEDEQDMPHKIEICKNIKKNTKNFIDLTEEEVKPLLEQVNFCQSKYEKINKCKNQLKTKKLYSCNNFMKKTVIRTLNLTEYIPDCITNYACNKEIFDKQTEATKTIFYTGAIDFDKFFDILNEEINFNDDDKGTLGKLVDIQMNDFLHTNINSLTLLFPKMQFFMDYYNKYQDDLVFFVDTKHVCMVYGMMHILQTILKCTENMINEIKEINSDIIECSNTNRTYKHYGINSQLSYFYVTKFEIEKMLLYILQSFLPTNHFVDLVNVFHIESICELSFFAFIKGDLCMQKPRKTESAILQMLMYCYIHFDTLETFKPGTQKNVTLLFFRYFIKRKYRMNFTSGWFCNLILKDLLMRNNCLSIYILKNTDKLCSKLKKTYDKLVIIHNHMQNMTVYNKNKKKDKNYLQTIVKNGECNKIISKLKKNGKYEQKRNLKYRFYNKQIIVPTKFYAVVFFVLNCMCNSIIASQSTFIMSYNITSNKKEIYKVIDYFMEIVENWNDASYTQKNPIEYKLSFSKPTFHRKKIKL
ncbi:hypothetical protein BDAP_001687 [Binucleata daphniae]